MARRGLYVGRFQPFHLGHLSVVREILKEVEELVVVIGSAQYSHTLTNPFTAGERLTMVRRALEEAGIEHRRFWIVPVPDTHLHKMWIAVLEGYTPSFDVVYSNEPLTRRLFKEAGHKIQSIRFFNREIYSSTEIREKMVKNENWRKLVPESVAILIEEIDGVNRLKDLAKTDKM